MNGALRVCDDCKHYCEHDVDGKLCIAESDDCDERTITLPLDKVLCVGLYTVVVPVQVG